MDDSIQTLKAEMNKLMSVYDDVKLKPDKASVAPDSCVDQTLPSEEQRANTMITEAGREVLEVKNIIYELKKKSIIFTKSCLGRRR